MPDDERRRLRETFEEVPELYDRARPSYPEQLFDDLVELAQLGPGARFEIVAVELGENLAALARRRLADSPNVEIVNVPFEAWETDSSFDAVVAFTALHWIDPEVRFTKPARLLREAGSLAVVTTKHVLPNGGDRFWTDVQQDYDAVVPSDENEPPPLPDLVPDLAAEIDSDDHFCSTAVRRYLQNVSYTADEYLAVLDTYSGHRSMEEHQRRRLYERIRSRIGNRTVRKTYLFILNVAARARG